MQGEIGITIDMAMEKRLMRRKRRDVCRAYNEETVVPCKVRNRSKLAEDQDLPLLVTRA